MIGAMPAVAVRHERRKQEKKKRPGQLYLANYATKQTSSSSPCPSRGGSPSPGSAGGPSPLLNTPPYPDDTTSPSREEFYVCGKVSVLHVVVVSLLLGGILLIVGLVQLKPGADASDHRYYILGSGSVLVLLGTLLMLIRCCMVPLRRYLARRRFRLRRIRKEESAALALAKASQNGGSGGGGGGGASAGIVTAGGSGGSSNVPHEVHPIQEASSAEEAEAATSIEMSLHQQHNTLHQRNGGSSKTALLMHCQSVSIEMGPHSSRDTLVSAKSPSEHDGLLQQRNSIATTTST